MWLAERQPGLQGSVHTSLFIFAVGRGGEGYEQRGTGQVMLLLVGSRLGVREVSQGRGLAAPVGVGSRRDLEDARSRMSCVSYNCV